MAGELENVGDLAVKWRESGGKDSGSCERNPVITIPELASITGTSVRTIERKIQTLQKGNLLVRVGAANGGSWEITA